MARYLKNLEINSSSYSVRLPNGSTALRSQSPVDGQIRYNSDIGEIEAYYGGIWNTFAREGEVVVVKDQFLGTGALSTFTMSYSYASGREAQALIFVGGVFQNPAVAYTFNGTTTVSFTSPPPLGQQVVVLHNLPSTATTA